MLDRIGAFLVGEGNWLPLAMGVALIAVVVLVLRGRQADVPARRLILAAMNLFFGITIGIMAVGHTAAVTTKLAWGTLSGSVPLLYAIGLAIGVPAWWLAAHSRTLIASRDAGAVRTTALNGWLAATLMVLGLANAPLVVPALLNIAYERHSRPATGWVVVSLASIVNLALLIGGLIFMASGQTFEQFSGMK